MGKLSQLSDALNAKHPQKKYDSSAKLVEAVNEVTKSVNMLAVQFLELSRDNDARLQKLVEALSEGKSPEIKVDMPPPDMNPLVSAINSLEKIVKANNKSDNVDFEIERDADGKMTGVKVIT